MKSTEENNTNQVLEMLETLRETPPRDPRVAARARSKFLAEARSIELAPAPSPIDRLRQWMAQNHLISNPLMALRKERSWAFSAIASVILVFAVVLGGGGITAYAAQGSLPNETLYPVKLYLENTRYSLASDLETQVSLLTSFANNRIDEAVTLNLSGEDVPQDVMYDLQVDLDTMLLLAADAEEDETEDLLKYIRQNLRDRDQLMTMAGQPEDVDPVLGQLRAMLQAQHHRAQAGVEDPLQFRLMFKHNLEELVEVEDTDDANGPKGPNGNQNGDCSEEDCEPQGPQGPKEGTGGGNDDASGPYEWGDPGSEDPGNSEPGNPDPGNPDPGSGEPGDPDPGDPDPGNPDPGAGDPGNPDPGNPDPGNPDPGNPDPGNPDPPKPGPGRHGLGKKP